MAKGWTEERRKKQAEMIRKTKPWENATGPKTQKGKDASKYNALKSGRYTDEYKEIKLALAANRDFLKLIKAWVERPDLSSAVQARILNKTQDAAKRSE